MKLAVHWAPLVKVCTPGWMAPVPAAWAAGIIVRPAPTSRARTAEAARARRARMSENVPRRGTSIPGRANFLTALTAHVQEDPSCRHGDHQRRAAKGDERQGHAGDRKDADDGADVDESLADDPRRDAGRQEGTETVGRLEGGAHPEDGEGGEEGDDEQGAEQPQLLADDGEDEVGVGVGQEAPLGPAGTEA